MQASTKTLSHYILLILILTVEKLFNNLRFFEDVCTSIYICETLLGILKLVINIKATQKVQMSVY